MLEIPEKIVIFDLECTTWEGSAARNWSGEGEYREIVQIGAVLVDTVNWKELDHFEHLVKPTINPVLSDYFTELTNITQENVDTNGIDFSTMLDRFAEWVGVDLPLYCFEGRIDGSHFFDPDVLDENCKLSEIVNPINRDRFQNINKLFSEHGYYVQQSGSAPKVFGIKLPAHPHDALNDARGLMIGLEAMSSRA